jgi:dnd system-associated protein 4
MTTSTDVRARRPQHYQALMVELQEEAGFGTFRDILIFAAAVGFRTGRRSSFTAAAGDPIRYEVLTVPVYSEALINMIAAASAKDDPEIMDDKRIEERVKIFEEYANGGLEYIQEQVNIRHQSAALVVADLVTEALSDSGGATAASVEELLGRTTW